MSKTARFPIGLTFTIQRGGKNGRQDDCVIEDIYTTTNRAGEVVRIEYVVTRSFLGQDVREIMVDTTIARSLDPEILKQYL